MTPRKRQILPLLEALVDPRLWDAACTGRAPLFDDEVPGESDGDRIERLSAAFQICKDCPVQAACHTAATEHQGVGMWAGRLRQQPEQFTSTRKRTA